ncbi:hypothetical protein [Streptomyces sp. NPDC050738]|uniref:hypothetical protein n=1 Tax=Streptomyces sp. NPDC050738 TaxID=3154744 RepID=UPI003437E47D
MIAAFAQVDAELAEAALSDPQVLTNDAHLESLLRNLAQTLHVGPANFCWFRVPAKARCLRLAGTPHAMKPLVGMCGSARCPQATHHPCHRPVWAGQPDAPPMGQTASTRRANPFTPRPPLPSPQRRPS